MPIEINGAEEATVAPIREALKAARKSLSLRYPDAEDAPPSSELPAKATRAEKLLGFDADGAPEAIAPPAGPTTEETLENKTLGTGTAVALGSDATGDIYYRDSGGVLQRLPIGTAGQVLTVVSGLPAWVTP